MTKALMLLAVFLPIAAAWFIYPLRRRDREYRNLYIRIIPGIELAIALLLALLPRGTASLPEVCGLGLHFATGSFQSMLAVIAAFLWMMTALPCREYFEAYTNSNRFYFYWLLTLGALMGVFLAADLFTLFVFFEMMSFTSWVWVAWPETPKALDAAKTYLAVAVFGGMVLLVGLFVLQHLLGTLRFTEMAALAKILPEEKRDQLLIGGICCLVGFGAKAGMFPLHIWLPKAHPVAPAPASALLSGILTKSGVFGILVVARYLLWNDVRWNETVLLLGTITMVLGAVLALFSIDLKRTLACSSMSQIGFILLGVAMQGYLGEENALAAWGTVLHMLNHSLIKLVLFVAAGVIYLGNHHQLDLNVIRGYGRNKPFLKTVFFIGAASIAGIPGFSGYVSKTLLHESIVEYIHELLQSGENALPFEVVEWLFLISGGLTLAYMTKLFICIFVEQRPAGASAGVQEYLSPATRVALTLGATAMGVLGLTPGLTMEPIARWAGIFLWAGEGHAVHYFALVNLKGALVSIAIGIGIYAMVVCTALRRRKGSEVVYPDLWPEKLDLETLLYRPVLRALSFLGALCARIVASVGDFIVFLGEKLLFLRAPGIFVPKRTENFGAYEKKPRRLLITEAFSFDLLLAGGGLLFLLVYILFA
ncbi:MAG: sodium:proton antiporter [Oscillibacter sp.]|jgi:hydrogenase-4 component B|nr:sodium:proton antiporter [Oscillibacter sp.]